MKKIFSLITSIALCFTCASTTINAASGINTNEKKILDSLKTGVRVDGKTVNLNVSYINAAETYFAGDDVNVNAADAASVIYQINAAKAIVVENKVTNLGTIEKTFQDRILKHIQAAAKTLGVTVSADYASKTIVVRDKNGKILVSASKTIKNTGDNFASTLAIAGVIALILAGAGVVAVKKGLFVKK